MEKENSVGKIINCDTGVELSFSLTPIDFNVEEAFELKVEPCLGRASPVVSFHGGSAKTLSTQVIFDKDADEKLDVQKVQKFISEISKVSHETKSIPLLNFKMGEFSFKGYPSRMMTTHGRFSTNGQSGQIRWQFTLVSVGEDSNEKS